MASAHNRRVPTLSEVVGANLRRIRGERSQDVIAAKARTVGLSWSRSTVAAVEGGHKTLDAEELTLAALALDPSGHVAGLLAGDGDVRLSDRATLPLAALRAMWGSGEPMPENATLRVRTPGRDERIAEAATGEVEQKAARKLTLSVGRPIEATDVAAASFRLWRRSLTDERDRQLGDVTGQEPRTIQARRGRITRHLLEALEQTLREEA